jgi:pentose-5-phosphate-3-epimerase
MIEDPRLHSARCAGADWISVHVETCRHLIDTPTDPITRGQARRGSHPATSLSTLDEALRLVDYVLPL